MKIKSIGLVLKDKSEINIVAIKKVCDILSRRGIKVYIEDKYSDFLNFDYNYVLKQELYNQSDVIMALGGDGTLISSARNAALYNKPVVGINMGHLGFLSELEKDDLPGLDKLLNGDYRIEERMMINCQMTDINGKYHEYDCLNDIILSRGSYSRMIDFSLKIGDEIVESYTADGMIFATPTGSTAYSLSAGGPVSEPNLNIIIATPICPHSFKNKSIIFGSNREIVVSVNEKYNKKAFVSPDGQKNIESVGNIVIKKSKYTTKLIRINNKGFYSILKEKMSERGAN